MSRLRHRLTGCSALAAALLTVAVPAASAATPAGLLHASSTAGSAALASTGINDNLNGDSCTGSVCMAVGNYTLGAQLAAPLAERLSGGIWATEPVPSPAHGANVFANEVSCASPASCLLVGAHWAGKSGPSANLAEAWNGTSWRIVTAPAPVRKGIAGLNDVACPTVRFCMAVGQSGLSSRGKDSAYTWTNGTTWREIPAPRVAGARNSEFGALACFNARNCMAVGSYQKRLGHSIPFAARWHNGRWQLLATPAVRGQILTLFQSISCPAATLCIAVGNTEDSTSHRYYHAFAEVWSNGKWHVSTLRAAPSLFIGVSCPARNRCFASGYTFPSPTTYSRALLETWNGQRWATQHAIQGPAPTSGGALMHVSCASRTDCEAVGYRFNPSTSNSTQTLAEKWTGSHWTLQATVNP
jgi:hypothetical protein